MKIILIILAFIPQISFAQAGTGTPHAIAGEINIPAIQSIKVELINSAPVQFESPDDIKSAKIILGLYKVTVISTIPWTVNVTSSSSYLSKAGSTEPRMPVAAIQLRNASGVFVPLSTSPLTIFKSTNEKIVNVFYVDVKVKAEIEYGPGKFGADLLFAVTPD